MLFARRKRRISRLLIVEDEPLVAFDTEHLLADADYQVVATVDRVADALQVLAAEPLDLVLVDLALADGSGVDVAQAAAARDLPVLFVTGGCPADAEALAAGCLSKPYGPRDLLAAIAAVDDLLDGRPPRRVPAALRLFERA
jgi:DNA-binding response OmpR family regulator